MVSSMALYTFAIHGADDLLTTALTSPSVRMARACRSNLKNSDQALPSPASPALEWPTLVSHSHREGQDVIMFDVDVMSADEAGLSTNNWGKIIAGQDSAANTSSSRCLELNAAMRCSSAAANFATDCSKLRSVNWNIQMRVPRSFTPRIPKGHLELTAANE